MDTEFKIDHHKILKAVKIIKPYKILLLRYEKSN